MQDPKEIEASYNTPDPWCFQTTPDDQERKQRILSALQLMAPGTFHRVLDIGCGEAWITKDLPAMHFEGFELSEQARSRFPHNVKQLHEQSMPDGLYDLVVATGVLYKHYDIDLFLQIMRKHSSNIILTCNIKSWEIECMSQEFWHRDFLKAKQIHVERFPYREYTQTLRIFRRIDAK